jgi:hypothetical protein
MSPTAGVIICCAFAFRREIPSLVVWKILLVKNSLHRRLYTLHSIQISVRAPPADLLCQDRLLQGLPGCLQSMQYVPELNKLHAVPDIQANLCTTTSIPTVQSKRSQFKSIDQIQCTFNGRFQTGHPLLQSLVFRPE